eukprot:NODE_6606_length_1656_cov_3.844997.p1 GENE.NODE_6606_length_1656_cov_3.844997~~NODE_6606_length_1656_cov_3.844997.p1  ORF type:complete len:400 (+),score=72.21 NODE_6606_length_1656_cov_3.844997:88-1287(+)
MSSPPHPGDAAQGILPAYVPDDFGALGGARVANADTVLSEVDHVLGVSRPPALQVIFAEHHLQAGFSSNFGRFGHIAMSYRRPDGSQRVVNVLNNITSRPGCELVHSCSPAEYFFGTKDFDGNFEQGGVYNRAFCCVRLEELPPETLEALDSYWTHVDKRARAGALSFSFLHSVRAVDPSAPPAKPDRGRMMGLLTPAQEDPAEAFLRMAGRRGGFATVGSCSVFTAQALINCGLTSRWSYFPKTGLFELLDDEMLRASENVHVVYIDRVHHACKHWPNRFVGYCLLSPTQLLRSWLHWDLTPLADAVVSVPAGSTTAVVQRGPGMRPKSWERAGHYACLATVGLGILSLPARAPHPAHHPVASPAVRAPTLAWRGWLRQRRGRLGFLVALAAFDAVVS